MSALGVPSTSVRGVRAVEAPAPRVRGAGLFGGWAGPGSTGIAEPSPALVTVSTPVLEGERFRRATRECLLAVAAVRAAAADGGLAEAALEGERTGLVYASATAYAAANRLFLEDERSTTLHFPYTAPSAVPGEVTIAFGIRGPYVNLMGGGPAALQALWYAARWLADGVADRVLVLTVETVHEVWDLFGRARRLYRRPVVEGAACLSLEPGSGVPLRWGSAATTGLRDVESAVGAVLDAVLGARRPDTVAGCGDRPGWGRAERAALARRGVDGPPAAGPGEAMACGPLVALARARAAGAPGPWLQTAAWRSDYGAILWPDVMA